VHLQGVLPPENVPGFIRASDVMLIPSMNEGLPNASIEASACARSVFGSDTGGLREVIVHNETGLLLPPGDVDAWSSAIAEYVGCPERLQLMGANGRLRMEQRFDARGYAVNLVTLFRAIVERPFAPVPARNN
jgi:glycosyltransferase involved in cell wall biosynthesis